VRIDPDSPAVQKIIQRIARTGEARAVAIKHLWKELALDQRLIQSMARMFLDGGWQYDRSIDVPEEFACVSWALELALRDYERSNKCRVLDRAEVEIVLTALIPQYGKPKRRSVAEPRYEPNGQRMTWSAKNKEQALYICTLLSGLGFQPYYSSQSVSIYGPLTKRMKINQVIKKLDRVAV